MDITNYKQVEALRRAAQGELARRHIAHFFKLIKPDNVINWHHRVLLNALQDFVDRKIINLIVCMPPQHGKSEICSRILPAYILGKMPKKRIISASYNADNSAKFNRDVQRIIDSEEYRLAFKDVRLSEKSVRAAKDGAWLRNRDEFEVVEYGGYYKNAGIGGGITGRTADYAIIDDPVKGAADAASSTIRAAIFNWFAQDLGTRLNNTSQKLIIMTRWHEQDLVGTLLADPQLAKYWHVITLPAIKENHNNPDDPREIGEPLWPDFQGLARLEEARRLGERYFRCLYQQDPRANKDVLVYPEFGVVTASEYLDLSAVEVLGLDFGFNDELALVGTKISSDNRLFAHQYIYQKGLTIDGLMERLKAMAIGGRLLVCDNSRPELITHLRQNGFNAEPCEKGAGSVFTGIQLVKSYSLNISDASANLIVEAQNYEWLTDNRGVATEVPKGAKDHALDALRYAVKKQAALKRGGRPARYIDLNR